MPERTEHRSSGRTWPWALLALALYAALCALSVVWLSDWAEHGPGFARGYRSAQWSAIGMVVACGLVAWLLRDRAMHALLRLLARWSGARPGWRIAGAVAAALGVVLLIGALHWAQKPHSLPGLPAALRPQPAALQAAVCGRNAASPARPAAVPDDDRLRQALAHQAVRQPLQASLERRGLQIPRSADLATTLDSALQQRADALAACLTGLTILPASA